MSRKYNRLLEELTREKFLLSHAPESQFVKKRILEVDKLLAEVLQVKRDLIAGQKYFSKVA